MRKQEWDQKDLAERLSMSKSTLNKILKGSAMRATLSRVEDLQEIESVFDMKRGELLREMGLVAEATETRDRIAAESALTPTGREAVLALYDYYAAKKAAKVTPLRPRAKAAKKGPVPKVTPAQERSIKGLVDGDDNGKPPRKPKRPT